MVGSKQNSLPLQERIPRKNKLKRATEVFILFLLLSLLYHRLSSLHDHGLVWLLAFLCESWFTFVWLLTMNVKWNAVDNKTHPQRLSKRCEDLPAVDMFVTTADPKLEPPIMTVNTVLSLLAVEYPPHKLACYVSDDAGSPLTFYALLKASEFAKSWVPFCNKYNVTVRAPFVYFSSKPSDISSSDFLHDWELVMNKYEELCRCIDEAAKTSVPLHLDDEISFLSKFERGNHPTVVKVIWENKDNLGNGIPHLIYVAREKRPKHPHHYKAGAMNVLTRVSGVITNAPFMLNVDCDMFANNPEIILHGMCLLLGFHQEIMSGFVQCPQRFYGGLKDDPFGNQLVALQYWVGGGIGGLQGPFYSGTGCFHRRKIVYGSSPHIEGAHQTQSIAINGKLLSSEQLQKRFGNSKELKASAAQIISGMSKTTLHIDDLSARVEAAKQVSSCTYEMNTCWGQEVGWVYGSMTEDVQTGLRIHKMGWRSVLLWPNPPGFLGSAPVGGPASITQYKRWATGLLEVLVGRNSPIRAVIFGNLSFRQCLAYLLINIWALSSVPELCYALLAPYCIFSKTSFLPKASEPMMIIPVTLFIFYNLYTLSESLQCGLSFRTWWNNQRMQRIMSSTAFLFGLLGVILKLLGISETTFEVTRKDQNTSSEENTNDDSSFRRFTFDSSPLFVPATALVLLNLSALAVSALRWVQRSAPVGPGIGELLCCSWLVFCFWPFVRGLFFRKMNYGIPWPTIAKATVLGSLFLQLCRN